MRDNEIWSIPSHMGTAVDYGNFQNFV